VGLYPEIRNGVGIEMPTEIGNISRQEAPGGILKHSFVAAVFGAGKFANFPL
jgi:hypothetical protein